MKRRINLLLGFLFLGIGIIGAILPLLPSTCFFITSAYYFGSSSEKLENWMLGHPRIGPTIISWRKYRAIPKLGKIMACVGMSVSAVIIGVSPMHYALKALALISLVFSAVYVLTRPTLENLIENLQPTIE
jgi:uncharacterized membrane protein YbaN (DUF454 family)